MEMERLKMETESEMENETQRETVMEMERETELEMESAIRMQCEGLERFSRLGDIQQDAVGGRDCKTLTSVSPSKYGHNDSKHT